MKKWEKIIENAKNVIAIKTPHSHRQPKCTQFHLVLENTPCIY